jgi:hypothetical protein
VGAAAFRHADVDERDVGQVRLREPDGLLGVRGRPDQLDPILVTEELREGGAKTRFVIREEHPDGVHGSLEVDEGSVGGHRADGTGLPRASQASG